MARLLRNWMVIAAALVFAEAILPRAATAQPISPNFKQGWDKVTRFFNPSASSEPANDAISLSSQAKPSPELYLATARMYEQTGKLDLAEKQYLLGLRLSSTHLGLQMGYARLKDRQGRLDEAIRLYQEAAKAHPQEAPVFNDMGLCQARCGRLPDAVASLQQAAHLMPQRTLYRNNLATVFADMGQYDAALVQLKAVHNEAVACYNLGYLLQKKGEPQLAAQYFAWALERDPSLQPARIWLERMAASTAPGPQSPMANVPSSSWRTAVPPAGSATASGVPQPLPFGEAQTGVNDPRRGQTGSESSGINMGPDRRRPVALPPVIEAPPSTGQAPPDLSVPAPNGSMPGGSPGAVAGPSNRLSQRPLDFSPSRVRPLPPVEDAPVPPAGEQNDSRVR